MSYSSFFSSGLMAPPLHSTYPANSQPTTPTHSDIDLSDDDRSMDTTPQAPGTGSSAPTPSSPSPAPRMRRRRSSLTLGMSPMNSIKSPVRSAGDAWQRSRSRSGSLDQAACAAATSMMDRVARRRSGSMGTVLKRAGRRVPAMHPPPSQPLPALPNPNVLSSRPPLVTRTSSSHSASIPTLSVKGVQQSSASDHQLCSAGRTRDRSYSIASTASSCEPIHEDIKEN